jgi:hypothetical protein
MTTRKPKAAPDPQAWFLRHEISYLEAMCKFWTPYQGRKYGITEDARLRHIAGHKEWIADLTAAAERIEAES